MADKQDSADMFVLERLFPDAPALFSFETPAIKSVADKCDVVLDTNVLLLPYTTDSNSLKQIRKIYELLKREGRLFLPGRVAREFANRKADKLLQVWKALGDKSSQIVKPATGSYPLLEDLSEYSEVLKQENQLDSQINAYQKAVEKLRDSILEWGWANDPVSKIYRLIFSPDIIKEPKQSQEQIEKDLNYRYTNKIPPGYKDTRKDDRGVGDLLIWMTILELGNANKKPLVFVTGEEKADWFYRSGKRGMLPRYELIDEFRRESSGNALYITPFSEFLELFGAPPDVVSAVREEERTINLSLNVVSTSSVELNFSVDRESLFELAARDPRAAIKKSWELLANDMCIAANIGRGASEPDSVAIAHALARLESGSSYPFELILELKDLQATARKVFNQSQWAYDPSEAEARKFILRCEAARRRLRST